ncbi:hypothetical protein LWI29_012680 [Acer saccharum]|uniref:Uncharacterized protein n=1 Tax=Acer saccharum TaxID=4024 RepID=A0AA39SXN2_ACESA|nr:hypothetical protein LWI29_012680 [Acer saccharum]
MPPRSSRASESSSFKTTSRKLELYDLILQTNKECLKLNFFSLQDSTKNRDILGALWDKLSVDETKEEIILFKVVTLEVKLYFFYL